MFEVSGNRPSPVLVYFGQQTAAIVAVPIVAAIFGGASTILPSGFGFIGALLLIPALLAGFVLGYVVPKSRLASRIASFTWCLPLLFFSLLLIAEARQFGIAPAMKAFFSAQPGDNESLATLFFTMPTWSALTYSIGATFKRRASSASNAM